MYLDVFQEQVGWGSWLVNWTTLRCTSGSRSSDTLIIWYLLKITLKSHKYFMPLLLLWLHILCAWSMERLVGGQAHIAQNTQNAYCAFWKKHFKCILRRTLRMHNVHIWEKHWMYFAYIGRIRVTLIVSACQPGWEEIENLRGNFRKIEEIWEEIIQNEVSLGGSPTISVTLGICL